MDKQSQDDLTMEQLWCFMKTLRTLYLKNPSLFRMNDVESLRQRFQEILAFIKNMEHRDLFELLEALRKNLEENHVNYHVVSGLPNLCNGLLAGLPASDCNQNELVLMERLGQPWEHPLIQEVKSKFPSVTLLELLPHHPSFAELKRYSRNAILSLTSADLIVSETGSIILIDRNRSRGVLTTTPRRHVVIVPITRVIFSHEAVIELVGKILRLRTGKIDAHVHVISNPSRTGDIEKIIVYGAHGPLALDVYLLDVGKGLELAVNDMLMLKRFSGLLEFILIQAFPWLEETLRVLEIPCLDVVSFSWILEHHDKRKSWQQLFLLIFLRQFLISNGFDGTSNLIQEVVNFYQELITKYFITSEMSPQLALEEVESQLAMLFNEVFVK